LRFVGWILRIFSYLFHTLSALFLLGVAVIATISREPISLYMLPFEENHFLLGTYLLGLGGLLCVVLSITRWFKYALPIWAAGTVFSLVRGYFFSSYRFRSPEELKWAIWYIAASIVAFLGALWILKPRRGRLYL
jgi:hypothetical protein